MWANCCVVGFCKFFEKSFDPNSGFYSFPAKGPVSIIVLRVIVILVAILVMMILVTQIVILVELIAVLRMVILIVLLVITNLLINTQYIRNSQGQSGCQSAQIPWRLHILDVVCIYCVLVTKW
jgi:hypothetical protein